MAVTWGSANNTSTNGMRVGLELRYSGSGSSRTVYWEIWLWTKRSAYNSSASYSVSGSVSKSGSFSFSHSNNSYDWPTSNRTKIASGSFSRILQYGSTQSVSISGSVSGVSAVPGSASHSRSITLPARPYERPNTPTSVSVSRGSDNSHTITWAHSATTARPVSRFRVRRRNWDPTTGGWTSYTDRGTTSSKSYTDSTVGNWLYEYSVRAEGAGGNSTFGYASNNPIATTPAPVSNLKVTPTDSGNRITWTNNHRYTAGVTIQVYRREGSGSWIAMNTSLGATTTTLTHTSPSLTVTHQYRVRVRSTGPTLYSPYVESAVVQLSAPPNAPTNLGPVGAWDATEPRTFTWKHSPTDGSEQVQYQVQTRKAGGSWVVRTAVSSSEEAWTAPANLADNGSLFEIQVRTRGVNPTWGPWSATFSSTPVARPTASINTPTEEQVLTGSSVQVTWGYSGASPQSSWRVRLLAGGEQIQLRTGSGTTSSATLTGLEDATEYEVQVEVRSGEGLWSAEPDSVTFSVAYLLPMTTTLVPYWDEAVGGVALELGTPTGNGTTYAVPSHLQVWRAVNGGSWVLVADEVPLGTTIMDPIPAIGDGTVNLYRVTTVSVLPSVAHAEPVEIAVTNRMVGGWLYINGGPGMTTVVRLKDNTKRTESGGVVKVTRQYAGRRKRVLYSGIAEPHDWSISARLAPNVEDASTRQEILHLQALDGAVCYRDTAEEAPARWFGSMGTPSFSHEAARGEVSISFEDTDYEEGEAWLVVE